MEAVFRPEIFRTFFDDFRPVPVGTHRKLRGIHRKKFGHLPAQILLPVSRISSVFLQDLVTFQHLSCRILRDLAAQADYYELRLRSFTTVFSPYTVVNDRIFSVNGRDFNSYGT
jgi:hypothetical protein